MITNAGLPYAINIVAVAAFFALSAFIIMHILAAAPAVKAPVAKTAKFEAAHVVLQESYAGINSWVTANDIKITDNFGVLRTFKISDATHIVVKGHEINKATYTNLRVLDHVRVTTINDGSDERAETIVVP